MLCPFLTGLLLLFPAAATNARMTIALGDSNVSEFEQSVAPESKFVDPEVADAGDPAKEDTRLPDPGLSADSPLSAAEIATAQQLGRNLSVAEWLGPLAPVALSPFFGITCLSGMAIFGGSWVSAGNPLLGTDSPLHNPGVFWAFLVLTLITSLPRLTKVSKPVAQAVDQLEAWSGIITMLVLKMMISGNAELPAEATALVHAGVLSFTSDSLLMLAGVANILVINAVKFFFEILIWLTPVPFLDAAFEAANKSVCAGLMAIYAVSPVTATVLNITIFLICAVVFSWMRRREVFFRTMLLDTIIALLGRTGKSSCLTVFPASPVGVIPARARCRLAKTTDGWCLTCRRPLGSTLTATLHAADGRPRIIRGFFTNSLVFPVGQTELTFGRRSENSLKQIISELNAEATEFQTVIHDRSGVIAEFR